MRKVSRAFVALLLFCGFFSVSAQNTNTDLSRVKGTLPAANLPLATSSTVGAVKPDNTTITITNGIISAVGSGGAGLINAGSSLATAVSTCGSTPSVIQITQQITVSSSITVPSNCTLRFDTGGELLPGVGVTVTIKGPIEAPKYQQIFGGQGGVAGIRGDVPVEWYGAVGYATRALAKTGFDSTTAVQQATNSLLSGHATLDALYYRTTAPIVIHSQSNVGIKGVAAGYSSNTDAPISALLSTSATADIIDLTGTSSTYTLWNDFRDFSLERSVVPSGGAIGFNLSYTGGATLFRIKVEDSEIGFRFHASPSNGLGGVFHSGADWGFTDTTGYTNQALTGFLLDSSDGVAENTIYLSYSGSANNTVGTTTTAWLATGTAINDVDANNVGSSNTSYGLRVLYSGDGTPASATDFVVRNATFDNCSITCVLISGIPQGGYLAFTNLYAAGNSDTSPSVQVTNSHGVIIQGAEIGNTQGGGGMVFTGGSGHQVINTQATAVKGGDGLRLDGTTNSIIANPIFDSLVAAPMTNFIHLVNSATGIQLVNVVGTGPVTNGILADSGSTGNNLCNTNLSSSLSGIAVTCTGGGSSYPGVTSNGANGLNIGASSGTTNASIDFGANYGALALIMYDGGTAIRYGWGLTSGMMNFVVPSTANSGGTFGFSNGGDLDSTKTFFLINDTVGTRMSSALPMCWTSVSTNIQPSASDTCLWRDSASVVDVGNSTAGDKSGTLNAAFLTTGSATVYRCATAGTLPVGALTTATGNCGTVTDTGLKVK